ncbi:vang-like protein 1 [Trichonephila inaurata madagascariensis]|uniref:Vang-like protein n=1 Tax=Trichonephila inaurata madagascariensis TaxID=2747483 RepID=A0A8X6IXW3_9ARAC|nr:vang-like protein 1 [Trichonephila inaurata madagascariensis]
MSLWTGDIHVGTGINLPRKPNMETESVRSCYSEQSSRSRRSRAHSTHGGSNHHGNRSRPKHLHRTPKSDRSHNSTIGSKCSNGNDSRTEEFIEVQILSQDDNWGDNTTAITGNTSDHSGSLDDISKMNGDYETSLSFYCHMWVGTVFTTLLSFCAFASPIVMIILPKVEALDWKVQKCGPECDGLLISLSFKLLILLFGSWALFFRRPKVTLPRIFIYRAIVLALMIVFTFAYWLFYGVRIIEKRHDDYHSIVLFAVSLVDTLLFIHYLAVILIEIRQLNAQYFVKVVRSPDGESHCYTIGQLSIQRAAALILEFYYRDFSIYNPYLETIPTKSRKMAPGFKMYDVDNVPNSPMNCSNRSAVGSDIHRRDSSHNERFYEEHEYERRVRKRKARLVSAAEESFTHIKRLQDEQGPAIPMDPSEAAQAIFPSMAKALQKYLRITRQQPRHTMQSILDHLALCLSHDLSPKAFLEKYLVSSPVLQNDREHRPSQTWALVCDTLLSRPVEAGCIFMLRQNDISLLVTISRLPHLCITEEVIDPKSNKFVLRLNSETSV